jgi:dephospho-CoA kinase
MCEEAVAVRASGSDPLTELSSEESRRLLGAQASRNMPAALRDRQLQAALESLPQWQAPLEEIARARAQTLLFENGLDSQLDDIVVVYVPEEIQMERLMARDNLSREQAKLRLQSQWPIEKKKGLATWVVDNSQSLEATLRQAEQIYLSISKSSSVQ